MVTAINGHSLKDAASALELAAELKAGTRFVADVRRDGRALRLGVKSR